METTRHWSNKWRWLPALALVAILAVPPASATVARAQSLKAQPVLLQLAAARPGATVTVIVQATGSTTSAQELVHALGGKVGVLLPIINGFSATIRARMLPKLAGAASVRWVSTDAPVVHASSCTQCINTANLLSLESSGCGRLTGLE